MDDANKAHPTIAIKRKAKENHIKKGCLKRGIGNGKEMDTVQTTAKGTGGG
jgi:hypothetical protein